MLNWQRIILRPLMFVNVVVVVNFGLLPCTIHRGALCFLDLSDFCATLTPRLRHAYAMPASRLRHACATPAPRLRHACATLAPRLHVTGLIFNSSVQIYFSRFEPLLRHFCATPAPRLRHSCTPLAPIVHNSYAMLI